MNRSSALLLLLVATLAGCSKGDKNKAEAPPAPVLVAKVVQKDMPVLRKGIGHVESIVTVEVRARVAGELMEAPVKEGEAVKKDDLLFQIDPAPFQATLQQARAALSESEARAREASIEKDRNAKLLVSDAESLENYQKSVARADTTRGQVALNQAAVRNAELNLQYCTIRSPQTGVVGKLLVDRGNLVGAYGPQPLITVRQIQPIYVTFSLPERYFWEVQQYKEKGTLKVQAFWPDTEQPPAAGVLTFVDNKVNKSTGMITLQGTFDNTDHRLWPGQFIEAVVTVRTEPDALVVPARAVGSGPQGEFVFVVRDDKTVEVRRVVKDRLVGDEAVIRKGLKKDEVVVTEGQLRLHAGAKVEIRGE